MNKKLVYDVVSIVLYVAAFLLFAFSVWAVFNCAEIISQAKDAGQLMSSGDEYTVVNFYLTNGAQFFIYALILAALAMILQKDDPAESYGPDEADPAMPPAPAVKKKPENYGEEYDEWFEDESEGNKK